jgi:hypothetical protein
MPSFSVKFTQLSRTLQVGFTITVLLFSAGCGGSGDHYNRHAISGVVMLDGQPLSSGNIIFYPEQQGPVVSGGHVSDGKFEIPKKQGLPAGSYKVSITSSQAIQSNSKNPEELVINPPDVKSLIPKKYNTETTVVSKVEDTLKNVFTYELISK